MAAKMRAAHRLLAQPEVPFTQSVGRAVNRAVGFDGFCLFAVDPLTGLRCAMFSEHGLTVSSARLMRNETVDNDVNRYANLIHRPGHTGLLKLGAGAPTSPRLNDMLLPQGYSSELRLVLLQDGRYWGGLSLFRDDRRHPFNDADAEAARDLADLLCSALRRHLVRRTDTTGAARPAGAVLVGCDGRLLSVSPEAQAWLDDLTSGGPHGVTIDDASRVVYEVAHATTTGQRHPVCRVRTRHGRWLVMTGTRTDAAPVGVTVVLQPADPRQSLPALGAWCGLTRRESQVVELVAGGLASKQVARRLGLSVHTANDHLSAAYRKAGVSGRDELLALAT
jgi:DNA-binding CsgD family transcriptional regulator